MVNVYKKRRIYEDLANSIILQAVKEYRVVLKSLKKNPTEYLLFKKHEIEDFFRSEWFATLTNIDPEILIIELQNES